MSEVIGKRIMIGMGCLLLVVLFLIVLMQRNYLSEDPFMSAREFSQPSYASTAADGKMLVIDFSKTRVTVLDGNKDVAVTIKGGDRSDNGFFYAEYAESDGQSIYISDVRYAETGTVVESEHILQYSSDGAFERVLFERRYQENMPLQYGNISSVQVRNDVLTFLYKTDQSLELYSAVRGTPSLIRSVPTAGIGAISNAYYNAAADSICVLTKRGVLYTEDGGALEQRSDWSADGRGRVPWELASDSQGRLFLTDLGARSVIRLPGYTPIYSSDLITYRFTANEQDIISFTDNETVYQLDTDGEVLYASAEAGYSAPYYILRLIIWAFALIIALAVLYAAVRLTVWLIRSNRSKAFKISILLGFTTILTSSLITASVLETTSSRLAEKNHYSLTQLVLSLSELSRHTFGDDLESINSLSDYGGEHYMSIRRYLDVTCTSAAQQGSNMYYILYKFDDTALYGVMDYEDTIGAIYPVPYFEDTGYDDVAFARIPYFFESAADSYGYWAYIVAPVYNTLGEIVGLIEIGSDLYSETLQNQAQVFDIVVSTAVLLVLFLLLLSEATAVAECFPLLRASGAGLSVPELVRPLAFLVFFAESTSAAFIPQLSAKIFDASSLTFPASLGAALPMSIAMFFMALTSLAGGAMLDRLGMKRVLFCGIAVQFFGSIVTAIAVSLNSYTLLLVAKALTGCGMGLIIVSCNTLPTYFADASRKNSLFSGVNVGMTSGIVVGLSIGSYVSHAAGYSATFIFSAIILIPAFALAVLCVPREKVSLSAVRTSESGLQKSGLPLWRFMFDRRVFSFLIFLMFPFLVIMYFKDYMFPLYASASGYSDVDIGNVLLFSGALSILLAPALSKYTIKYMRDRGSAMLANGLYAAALLAFALIPSLQSSVAAVYVLSIAGCFGLVTQGIYYSSLRASHSFGIGKAMGVFSLFDNLAQTIGPILFGVLLLLGYETACLIIAGVSVVMLALFAVMSRGREPLPEITKIQKGEETISL